MSNINKRGKRLRLIPLEIDRNGLVSRKVLNTDRDTQLDNTLLEALCPQIRVVTVDVPMEPLEAYEQARVEQTLTKLELDGIRYSLIGASGSAKEGKYYAVDVTHEKRVAERFRFSPEAAITYFGILVSPCQVRIEEPDVRVLVVDDHQLGTNDCRGWISESLFAKLQAKQQEELLRKEKEKLFAQRQVVCGAKANENLTMKAEHNIRGKVLPAGRFYQFRVSFDKTQAKGSFKVMGDDVAQHLEADVILPKSSIKPEYEGGVGRFFSWLLGSARMFRGPVVVGIREVSRDLEFVSSYTLVEHAPEDSIELEIKPYALEQVRKLKAAVETRDFDELFRLLGTTEAQQSIEADEVIANPEYTSTENTIVEAVLKADPTGFLVKHPFINNQLQRLLVKWAFKVCTSGGFRLPAFALADDGYLLSHEGKVCWGSDWIPQDRAISSLGCEEGLCIRYPIRMKEDLLPFNTLNSSDTVNLLTEHLRKAGCAMSESRVVEEVYLKQLRLEGTFALHSETARKNGGDFDFDWVCVLEGNRFPRFVESRFAYRERFHSEKTKHKKKASPWWNLPQVALKAKGNQVGSITDLKTSCLAAGQVEEAYQLVLQLQNALDQLKHAVEPDQDVITRIRKEVPPAPWLKFKRCRRISELPLHVEAAPTDRIGSLYNFIRKEINDFFSDVLPLGDFRGVIAGGEFDREMYRECGEVSRIYGANVTWINDRRKGYEEAVRKAEADFEKVKNDAHLRKEALFRLRQAQAALHFYEERSRKEMRAIIHFVRKWGHGKQANRPGWLQALHVITCKGSSKSSGSIEFYAFPQEIVNQMVERTGGRPVVVAVPNLCDGEVEIDPEGRIFLVDQFLNGDGQVHERLIFLMQVTEKGEVLMDRDRSGNPVRIERIRPFPMQAGRSAIVNGKVAFPETQQRPFVPPPNLTV